MRLSLLDAKNATRNVGIGCAVMGALCVAVSFIPTRFGAFSKYAMLVLGGLILLSAILCFVACCAYSVEIRDQAQKEDMSNG